MSQITYYYLSTFHIISCHMSLLVTRLKICTQVVLFFRNEFRSGGKRIYLRRAMRPLFDLPFVTLFLLCGASLAFASAG